MSPWIVVAIAVVVVAAVVVAVVAGRRSDRSRHLQDRFGAEYDRRLDEGRDRRSVEQELRDVERRRERLEIRPLSEPSRVRYSERWHAVQAEFVDRPDRAVDQADALVAEVMRERGYPVDDFEDRVDMVAADHPELVEHYVTAHRVAERNREQFADTDELRQALLHYRRLFEQLLEHSASAG